MQILHWLGRTGLCGLLLAGGAQAQTVEAGSASRAEMSMEWVRSSRPVLKPLQAMPPEAPQSLNPPAASQTLRAPSPSTDTPPQVWSIELADKRLSPALQRWAVMAGWLLVWEADRDFLLDANLSIEGDFLYAIEITMRALADTDYPLQASANPLTRVLRISRYQAPGQR
jgi:hypothetical protein